MIPFLMQQQLPLLGNPAGFHLVKTVVCGRRSHCCFHLHRCNRSGWPLDPENVTGVATLASRAKQQ